MFGIRRFLSTTPLRKGTLSTPPLTPADFITDLYISEIRKFVPTATKQVVDLKDTFVAPKLTMPEFTTTAAVAASSAAASATGESWPAIVNAIDDPSSFCDAFDWENDDGSFYPKRRYPKSKLVLRLIDC